MTVMARFALILLVASLVHGCSGRQAGTITAQFEPKDAMYIFTVGRGSIHGTAFVKTADGKRHAARRSKVTLVPATQYAEQRIEAIYRGRQGAGDVGDVPAADGRYSYFTRKTTAVTKGAFSFIDISDGEYFVTTVVQWGRKKGQARALIKRVLVKNNAKVKVTLSEDAS